MIDSLKQHVSGISDTAIQSRVEALLAHPEMKAIDERVLADCGDPEVSYGIGDDVTARFWFLDRKDAEIAWTRIYFEMGFYNWQIIRDKGFFIIQRTYTPEDLDLTE